MLLAGAAENERGGKNCGGEFANTKMHNAPASYSGIGVSRKDESSALFLFRLIFV